ncbi:MAG: hypothetical protein CMF31_11010 [Kordiimonas sp.]|nr:hypothetical protein [Kordiimonas sp.]
MRGLLFQFVALITIGVSCIVLAFVLIPQDGWLASELDRFRRYPHEYMAQRQVRPVTAEHIAPLDENIVVNARPAKVLSAAAPVTAEKEMTKVAAQQPQASTTVASQQQAPDQKTAQRAKKVTSAVRTGVRQNIAKNTTSVAPETPVIAEKPVMPATTPAIDKKKLAQVQVQPPEHEQTQTQTQTNKATYDDIALGYQRYAEKDFAGAAGAFTRAINTGHRDRELDTQLAYAHKKAHHNSQASQYFRKAIDQHIPESQEAFYLRREVEQLENRFTLNGYWILREQAIAQNQLPLTGASLAQSQAGLEGSYQPPHWGFNDGRQLQIFGRLLWAVDEDRIDPIAESTQGSLGVRYRPLRNHNLWFSAERLIAIGEGARNDWMLRASYSWDRGTDWREDTARWFYTTLYADLAMVRPQEPEWLATAQALGGVNVRLARGWALRAPMH